MDLQRPPLESLIDILMVGATVQDDLYSIIKRFRVLRVALSADKMYRQVALDVPNKVFHRIICVKEDVPVLIFRMTRVAYDIASSAFRSTRYVKEVAKRICNWKVEYHLEHSFYVDDVLGGLNSVEDARKLIVDLPSRSSFRTPQIWILTA